MSIGHDGQVGVVDVAQSESLVELDTLAEVVLGLVEVVEVVHGSVGSSHHMNHHVVAVQEVGLGDLGLHQHLGPLALRSVRLLLQHTVLHQQEETLVGLVGVLHDDVLEGVLQHDLHEQLVGVQLDLLGAHHVAGHFGQTVGPDGRHDDLLGVGHTVDQVAKVPEIFCQGGDGGGLAS